MNVKRVRRACANYHESEACLEIRATLFEFVSSGSSPLKKNAHDALVTENGSEYRGALCGLLSRYGDGRRDRFVGRWNGRGHGGQEARRAYCG